ncbi:CDPK adapter, putative (DUF1423) isoform X2 [Tasmannia lanceolata]
MEVDLDGSNDCTPVSRANGSYVWPVEAGASGEGLPYAPEDWPTPGDKWKWKVGRRKAASGHWCDRYLYPPDRIQKAGKKFFFASRQAIKAYLQKEFPNVDTNAFFNSFTWRVPSSDSTPQKEDNGSSGVHPIDLTEHSGSESTFGTMGCKAGNKMCALQVQAQSCSFPAMDCDVCCSETGFCRDCCCILCCKTIDWAYGGYSFIRCEARVNENYICGHVAHVNCALRSYMAGTVGGSIGLDVEYYCRRCDKKTDLFLHVTRLLKTCESLDSRDDIEKILNLGLCILRGSQQTNAKNLFNRIQLVLTKLKSGIYLEEIWMVEDNNPSASAGEKCNLENDVPFSQALNVSGFEPSGENHDMYGIDETSVYITSDHRIASSKLENEIDEALQSLRKSQESEYRIAEQKLYAHKDFLLGLYRQLDAERSELAQHTSSPNDGNSDDLLANVLSRVDQIKQEEVKHRHMMQIGKGFGRTPKGILKEHFGLPIED